MADYQRFVNILGIKKDIRRSNFQNTEFKNINVLGNDFLGDFSLTADYKNLEVKIDKTIQSLEHDEYLKEKKKNCPIFFKMLDKMIKNY